MVIFDKTGTLTMPDPCVQNRADVPADVLECAARLALSSRHPLAAAVACETAFKVPFDGATEEPGRGVRALVHGMEARLGSVGFCNIDPIKVAAAPDEGTSLIAFRHGDRHAVFAVSQSLRPDAIGGRATVQGAWPGAGDPLRRSRRCGGADRRHPRDCALACRFEAFREDRIHRTHEGAGPTRADGWRRYQRCTCAGRGTCIDSPISAAHITQGQADAVFMGERLQPVLDAMTIACRARRLMRQNLWLAALYNAIAIPIAVIGLVTPLIAAAAMSGSSILVTLNALRARSHKEAPTT